MAPITPISFPIVPPPSLNEGDGIADDTPNVIPTSGSADKTVEQGAYIQYAEEIRKLAQRNAWDSVEVKYQQIIKLEGKGGVHISDKVHFLGAQAAQNLGDTSSWYDRTKLLTRQGGSELNDADKQIVKDTIPHIESVYGRVDIILPSGSSYTLMPDNPPFSPDGRASLGFARAQLEKTNAFHGLLPVIEADTKITYTFTSTSETYPQGSFDLEPIAKNSHYEKIDFTAYNHLYYEMADRLRKKKYVPAEEDYQDILRLGIEPDGLVNYLGFQIAMENGNTFEGYKRVKKALENSPTDALKARVEGEVALIKESYGPVQIIGGRNVSFTSFPDFVGTSIDQEWAKKSIDFAKAQLALKGSFTGLIPVDNPMSLATNERIQYTPTRKGIPVTDKIFTLQSIAQKGKDTSYQQIDLSPSGVQVATSLKTGPMMVAGLSGGYAQLQASSGSSQTYSAGSFGATVKGMWAAPLGKSGFMLAPQASLTLMGDFYDPFTAANFNGFLGISAGYGNEHFLAGGGALLAAGFQAPGGDGEVTVGTLSPSIKVDRVVQTPIGGLFVYVNLGRFFFEGEWQHATPGLEGEMSQYPGYRSGGAFDNDRFILTAALEIKKIK